MLLKAEDFVVDVFKPTREFHFKKIILVADLSEERQKERTLNAYSGPKRKQSGVKLGHYGGEGGGSTNAGDSGNGISIAS